MRRTDVRTSKTHPLRIAEVRPAVATGLVGLIFCPGKQQQAALTGSWHRDLESDVAAIATWGTAAVVTLLEHHELTDLAVTELGNVVAAHHMEWVHLPIRDVSTPGAEFEAAWQRVGPSLRSRLRGGFNVLVHCKGGLGRAGMVAARLLIDSGWQPADALAAVRTSRPGAVETTAQEAYVLGLTAAAPNADESETTSEDRAVGALLGLAVGDTLGTTLEFAARDTKPRLTDIVGGGPFGLAPGQWTDDTAMALALADSLAAKPMLDERDLMDRFTRWYREGAYSCTGRCFDIGVTTRQAIMRYEANSDPVAGSSAPDTAGNGSLMRLAPVAIAHWQDRNVLAHIAARQSRTTHAAAEAVDACIVYAELLADAISGMPRDELFSAKRSSASPAVQTILDGSWRGKPRSKVRSSGYVIHSLEAAIWSVARTGDFASAVLLAANLGDDADTVAAITGQLAGALYGGSQIPDAWLAKLAWRDRLTDAARALLA